MPHLPGSNIKRKVCFGQGRIFVRPFFVTKICLHVTFNYLYGCSILLEWHQKKGIVNLRQPLSIFISNCSLRPLNTSEVKYCHFLNECQKFDWRSLLKVKQLVIQLSIIKFSRSDPCPDSCLLRSGYTHF